MRLGRKARTGLGLSLGVLAGIAMILLPGLLTVTSSPIVTSHNDNTRHPTATNSTTTYTSQNNSTTITTSSLGSATNITSIDSSSGSNPRKTSAGSQPPTPITTTALTILVSTMIIPALGLSFVTRSWSKRKLRKNLEEDTSLLETS